MTGEAHRVRDSVGLLLLTLQGKAAWMQHQDEMHPAP